MSEITREDVLLRFSLMEHVRKLDVNLKPDGDGFLSNRCAVREHKPQHWCASFYPKDQSWFCHDCKRGGTIIDWISIAENRSAENVYKELAQSLETNKPVQTSRPQSKLVKTYAYTDENGNLLYEVCRFEPKDFRQRRPDGNGGYVWNLKGVERTLYRLPAVLMAQAIVVCEGEKDCDNLSELGFEATCNVCGAGKWLPAYADFLKCRDVVIIPDADSVGMKHARDVLASLQGKVNSAKLVKLPDPYKDSSEFIASFPDKKQAAKAIQDLFEVTPHALVPLPIFTIAEMEIRYRESLKHTEQKGLDLSKFLPRFGLHVRKIIPGELVVVMADTGVGKTAILGAMAKAAYPNPTLFFEMELPQELMFERFAQLATGQTGDEIEGRYRGLTPDLIAPDADDFQSLRHIAVCSESGLNTQQIEELIVRSELKMGMRPVVVFVDYIGLVKNATGENRYKSVSDAAENLRVIAKRTNTVIVVGTQTGRPDKKRESLKLSIHDAKDSGSIENSASLLIGAWRPESDHLVLKVLKNTKGKPGLEIDCDFDGARMKITQRSSFEP